MMTDKIDYSENPKALMAKIYPGIYDTEEDLDAIFATEWPEKREALRKLNEWVKQQCWPRQQEVSE